jgi:hypothetical protein
MASQMPGSRISKTLTLLGFIVLIIHCRPWSYAWFNQASKSGRDAESAGVAEFGEEQVHPASLLGKKFSHHVTHRETRSSCLQTAKAVDDETQTEPVRRKARDNGTLDGSQKDDPK